jgi:predicted alpha/beta superfamily hydrolase
VKDPQAVLAALEAAPSVLIPLLLDIPEPLRKRRPEPHKWSAHEHFCHLAAFEPVLRARLERMLGEENHEVTPYYPNPEEEAGAFLEVDLQEAIARFTRERAAIVEILRALPPEGWERAGYHPAVPHYTVFFLARHAVVHSMLHGYRIEETLFRRDWMEAPEAPAPKPAGPVTVAAGIPGSLARMRTGEVNVLGPFEVPGFTPRHVRVYLPRLYDPSRQHFALYLFDGQNVFDDEGSFSGGWYAHEAVEKLARSRRPVPVVIGIDHGNEDRLRELAPFDWEGGTGGAEAYLGWVAGSLVPALTAELNLVPGPIGAVLGGSSMGGLGALYGHFRYPGTFGGALVMSPSFWLSDQAIFETIADLPDPEVSRVYLDAGAKEDRGRLLPIVAAMAAHLAGRGWDADRLMWRPDSRGTHSEASWRRRLPKALRFMYR